jgi:hypothetical protein
MELDVDELAKTLVAEASDHLPAGRSFEFEIDVRRSLRQLANRIDEGYSIEVRAFVPPDEQDQDAAEGEAPPNAEIETARAITDRQQRMRRMNLTGRRILELPEGDEDLAPDSEGPSSTTEGDSSRGESSAPSD